MEVIEERLESGVSASTSMRAAAESLVDLQTGHRETADDGDRWEMASDAAIGEDRPSDRGFGADDEPREADRRERSSAGKRLGLASAENFEDTAEYGRLRAGTDRDYGVVLASSDRQRVDSDNGSGLRSRMRLEPSSRALDGGGLLRHPGPSGTGQAPEHPGDDFHGRQPGGASQSVGSGSSRLHSDSPPSIRAKPSFEPGRGTVMQGPSSTSGGGFPTSNRGS